MLATWGASRGFNPASLFAGGEQGAWYDPSDFSTMFTTSNGATAVTAVEQAVGLILDKSKGLALGSELYANQVGTFDNGTGGATATYTSATQTVSVTVAGTSVSFPRLAIDVGMVVGRTYLVSGRIDGTRTGIFGVRLATVGSANDLAYNSTTGVFEGRVSAGAASIQFLHDGTVTGDRTIASLSIREITGNHAFQSTSASRPTLRARYNLLTYSEQFSNAAWLTLGSTLPTKSTTTGTLPSGGVGTIDVITFPIVTGAGSHSFVAQVSGQSLVNVQSTFSVYARVQSGTGTIYLNVEDNLAAPTGGNFYASTAQTLTTTWQRISVTGTRTSGSGTSVVVIGFDTRASAGQTNAASFAVEVWGAQLLTAADATSTGNAYQRIAAATDYVTVSTMGGAVFNPYLAFDGTDDSLLTNSVDFATVTSDGQARRNLFLAPTLFDSGNWTKSAVTISANATAAPDGTTTADKIEEDNTSSGHSTFQNVTVASGSVYTMSCYMKKSERDFGWLKFSDGATNWGRCFNLATGQVGNVVSGFNAPTTSTITDVGNGWYRCAISVTAGNSGSGGQDIGVMATDGTRVYIGTTGNGIFLWGAQLETGSTATAFQNIGTDKMTVWAGLTKLSDAAQGVVYALGTVASNAGSFEFNAPVGAAQQNYAVQLRGASSLGSWTYTTYAAPVTNVSTIALDLANTSGFGVNKATARFNGVVNAGTWSTGDAGTGNFGAYALSIGRRTNSILPFNGRLYQLIVRGAASSASQIGGTEQYVAGKTGVAL